MANQLTTSGLTLGTLNNTITEIIDPNNSKMVICDNANVSKSVSGAVDNTPTWDETYANRTFVLPDISVGGSAMYSYQVRSGTAGRGSVTVKLPSSGTYAYVNSSVITQDAISSEYSASLSMNVLTAARASGGATVNTVTCITSSSWTGAVQAASTLYYRLK